MAIKYGGQIIESNVSSYTERANIVVLFLSMAFVMIVTFICMLFFEFLKQTLDPDITIWASHAITIIFITIIATILSYIITYRIISIKEKISSENRARVLAEESFRKATVRAESYLDLMGHDLRNLNQIGMGYLEFALDTLDIDDEKRILIIKSHDAMEKSTRLIDSVKKLQRVQNGDFEYQEIKVAQLIRGLIPGYIHRKDRDIKINLRSACECKVYANDLLNDVFSKIIENAIMNSNGPLIIDISIMRTGLDGKDYCDVALVDNGPGVSDEMKNKLFTRFEKDKPSILNSWSLELCLVKTLVEDYKGKILVEDAVSGDYTKGTKFIVRIPEL